ncbi:hypothetical protein BH23ACT9_BH23ACT9_28440 [soil metagenome]
MSRQTSGRRRPLWRASASEYARPWFYSSRDTAADPGRFDLASPHGTCYWAVSAAAAVIEFTADPDALDPPALVAADLHDVALWVAHEVPAARSPRLADTTVASIQTLNGEIATIVPYDLPWQWADAFHADGRTGIVYRGRFASDDAVALFGLTGIPDDPPTAIRHAATDHIDELPPAFTAHIGSVGSITDYETAPPP